MNDVNGFTEINFNQYKNLYQQTEEGTQYSIEEVESESEMSEEETENENDLAIINQPNAGNQINLQNGVNNLTNPQLSSANKFLIVQNLIEEEEKENKKLKKKIVKIQNDLLHDEGVHERNLSKQKEKNESLKKELDEYTTNQRRLEYIQQSSTQEDFSGAFLGSVGSFYSLSLIQIMTSVSLPLSPLVTAGTVAGIKLYKKISEVDRKKLLKKYEEEYFLFHPNSSKKEAFEYAVKKIDEEFDKLLENIHDYTID